MGVMAVIPLGLVMQPTEVQLAVKAVEVAH
jgi:hypothetical protein